MSAGCPVRPSEACAAVFFSQSEPMKPPARVPSVSTMPGLMELTRIFFGPSSRARTPVIPSMAALVPGYTGTKAAIDGITGVLARELGPKKIRVNSINPGMVDTEGTRAGGFIGSDWEKNTAAQASLGRTGQPADIATVAVFLAGPDSGWLTGERLLASGGLR